MPKSFNGAEDNPNISQFIALNDETTNNMHTIAFIIVECTNAFGTTFSPSIVSAARKVDVSHPKNVSAMKNIVIKMLDRGNTKNGEKLSGLNLKKPGMINANNVPKVIIPNAISITELVFIPL